MAASVSGSPPGSLFCTNCEAIVPAADDIVDFVGARTVADTDPQGFIGNPYAGDEASALLLQSIRSAAEQRWPAGLGEVLELGCGGGRMTHPLAVALQSSVRGVLAVDSNVESLRACRDRLTAAGPSAPVAFARLSFREHTLRDAVVDTVVGIDLLTRTGDVRALLAMVHRVLRPGGRAFFIAPNRRYLQAICQAMAAALVRRRDRDGRWPDGSNDVLRLVASLRRRDIHHGDPLFLSGLRDKHLFTAEALAELAQEVGFATVDVVPLDPDPSGVKTARRLCLEAGMADAPAAEMADLARSVGSPWFSLLSRTDASASMLLWLGKGVGPVTRTFSAGPASAAMIFAQPESALGGVAPRWSLELTANRTHDGIAVAVNGWCLVNTDILWVRLRIDGIARDTPVWLPRIDVHDVLNKHGLYHAPNALCSGLQGNLLFDGVHPQDDQCVLRLEVVLANGVILQGPAPQRLVMTETATISQ